MSIILFCIAWYLTGLCVLFIKVYCDKVLYKSDIMMALVVAILGPISLIAGIITLTMYPLRKNNDKVLWRQDEI